MNVNWEVAILSIKEFWLPILWWVVFVLFIVLIIVLYKNYKKDQG